MLLLASNHVHFIWRKPHLGPCFWQALRKQANDERNTGNKLYIPSCLKSPPQISHTLSKNYISECIYWKCSKFREWVVQEICKKWQVFLVISLIGPTVWLEERLGKLLAQSALYRVWKGLLFYWKCSETILQHNSLDQVREDQHKTTLKKKQVV